MSLRAFAILTTVALSAGPAAASSELRVSGRHFRDAAGRAVILRGVNVAGDAKVPPFRPITSAAVFEPLPGWGYNTVRLLFTWEAYEPKPGMPDASYLDYYVQAARWASERGLYVIVDFHQDAFSRVLIGGCGDGFPAWTVPAGVPRVEPDNGATCANWGARMISDTEMPKAWDGFYNGAEEARGRYMMMVRAVAARLDSVPGVIGYDLLNEPWGDEVTQLSPFYDEAARAIRAVSPSAIIFVSPHALTSAGKATRLPRPTFENFAYAPHFYDGSVLLLGKWGGKDPAPSVATMVEQATTWGVPLFVGEYGAPGLTVGGPAYLDALLAGMDTGLASGAQWVYTPGWSEARKDGWNTEDLSIVAAGQLRANHRSRPYAQRVAGTPLGLKVDLAARSVELSWMHEPAAGATQLYLPHDFFGDGETVTEVTGVVCVPAGESGLTCSSETAGEKRVVVRAPAGGSNCGLTGAESLLLAGLWWLGARMRRQRRRAVA